jgi:hypothetical protein
MEPELSPPEAEAPDIFLEYRLTSMLLSLIVAIRGDHGEQISSEYVPPLEKLQSPRRRALNALVNVLVRNTEAFAVTSDSADTLEVLVMQEANDSMDSTSLDHSTMVPNSRWSDPPGERPWLISVQRGVSRWAEIVASPSSFAAKP